MFHEFGHALQHMMTQQAEGLVAGIRGVEWDAVELPSQFMENWCYNRATLNSFGRHYETGEPLPEDLYKKLVAARTFRQDTNLLCLSSPSFLSLLSCLCHYTTADFLLQLTCEGGLQLSSSPEDAAICWDIGCMHTVCMLTMSQKALNTVSCTPMLIDSLRRDHRHSGTIY